ncbi:ferredoxin [Murinocardiopsis flavida]|uniref:Ferredoxin n=1 Tax=Murinocardiopsis flavida TaxID=645275 RepID=A0A2P8CXC1_9ACTN|nr:ferredoxin [Murinocardiopsis flavida]PSK89631.1 ferredoxin [Murinocardiopsis flavida]
MRIGTDREACAGAGMCALTAPAVFTQDDDDGRVVVLEREPDGEDAEAARAAVRLCPSRAITLSD